MKLDDVKFIKNLLIEIKEIADTQNYNISSSINQKLVQILPILNSEEDRLEINKVEINFPKIYIFTNKDALNENMTVQDYMNLMLKQLVVNGNKIIDYGKLDDDINDDNTRTIYLYIKYTD